MRRGPLEEACEGLAAFISKPKFAACLKESGGATCLAKGMIEPGKAAD
jgi:hypothetical protein